MRWHVLVLILMMCPVLTLDVDAQSVERGRPDAWKDLVRGGRFMDRFLPMPVRGELTQNTWGADNVVPRFIDNGIEDRE